MKAAACLFAILALEGCSLVSPDRTPEEARANAERRVTLRTGMSPADACAKVARVLSWCARGPNYHYRCTTALGGARSELVGELEAVYRVETFLVIDFLRKGADTELTLYQREGMLIHDFPPMVEKYLAGSLDCRPP